MKRIFPVVALILSILFSSCNAQETNTQEQTNAPKTNIKVNKIYDENGNLVRYDSTYTYYYSNIAGDTVKADSILNIFKNIMHEKYSFSQDPFFDNFFYQDSTFNNNFYSEDFFLKSFEMQMKEMQRLMQEMDSFKNQFFMQQFPKNNKQKEPLPELD